MTRNQKAIVFCGLMTLIAMIGALIHSVGRERFIATNKAVFSILLHLSLGIAIFVSGLRFATNRSDSSFYVLIACSGLLVLYLGGLSLSGAGFYYYGWFGLKYVLPPFFSFLTIVFAVRERFLDSKN